MSCNNTIWTGSVFSGIIFSINPGFFPGSKNVDPLNPDFWYGSIQMTSGKLVTYSTAPNPAFPPSQFTVGIGNNVNFGLATTPDGGVTGGAVGISDYSAPLVGGVHPTTTNCNSGVPPCCGPGVYGPCVPEGQVGPDGKVCPG
jgi:hypothetical protein